MGQNFPRPANRALDVPGVTLPWAELTGIQIRPLIIYRGWFDQQYHARVTPTYYAWWWLQQGHITIEIESRVYHVRAGEWIFLPVGGKRSQTFERGSIYTSINFSAAWDSGIPLLHVPSPIIQKSIECSKDLPALAEELCLAVEDGLGPGFLPLRERLLDIPAFIKVDASFYNFLEGLFREILQRGSTFTLREKADARLNLVLSSIRLEPQAGPLPFEKWRSITGLGRSQLDRLARRILGMSLHQFRDMQLLNEARKRLTTKALIKQVAEELGFVDTAHFCRWIRQHTGHAPQTLKTLQV